MIPSFISFCLSRNLDPKSKEHTHTYHTNHYFFISKTGEHSWDLLWFDLLIHIYEHVFYFSTVFIPPSLDNGHSQQGHHQCRKDTVG